MPRRVHKSHFAVFSVSLRTFNQKAHTVDKAHVCRRFVVKSEFYRRVRHKFGLSGHYRFAIRRLWQLVRGPFLVVGVGNQRQHKFFHKFSNKRRFPASDRSNYPDVDVAVCSLKNFLIDILHTVLHTYAFDRLYETFCCDRTLSMRFYPAKAALSKACCPAFCNIPIKHTNFTFWMKVLIFCKQPVSEGRCKFRRRI